MTANSGTSSSWLNQFRIGTRLLSGSVLPLCLFLVFSVWLWTSLGQVRTDVADQLTRDVEMALLAKDLERDVVQVQQFLSDISATRGQDGLDDGFKQAEGVRADFIQGMERLVREFDAAGDTDRKAQAQGVLQDFDRFYREGTEMARAYVAGGPASGNPMMGRFDAASSKLQASITKLGQALLESMRNKVKGVAQETQSLRVSAMVLCGVVIALALLFGLAVSRSITRPIDSVVDSIGKVAQGDLTFPITVQGRDETGQLLTSLKHMQHQFHEFCFGVRDHAEMVANASREIAHGNQDLSARTEQQASALQQTAASMSQLGATVRGNADKIRHADRLSQDAAGVSGRAGTVVSDMVQTMEGIQSSSRQISEIIGVIDAIAFQTNILALNAAVEAARAGEHGRGFAVVASEVRSLAGRSAEASKQIKQLITDSVNQVGSGTALVQSAGKAMQDVASSIQEVSGIMSAIARASNEQEDAIAQVDSAIQQIDSATQQNAALVEEMAAAAASLQNQAREMLDLACVFKVDDRTRVNPLQLTAA